MLLYDSCSGACSDLRNRSCFRLGGRNSLLPLHGIFTSTGGRSAFASSFLRPRLSIGFSSFFTAGFGTANREVFAIELSLSGSSTIASSVEIACRGFYNAFTFVFFFTIAATFFSLAFTACPSRIL